MELTQAILTRRTHKVLAPDPVPQALIEDLVEVARWAPNHNLTNPWRFRVLGPDALAALKAVAGPEGASKLDRAPTLVAVSSVSSPEDPVLDEEDLLASACATYALLLVAHGRGLAGYWRTPGVLRRPEGLAAVGIPPQERFVGLVHLGWPRQPREAPARASVREVLTFLD